MKSAKQWLNWPAGFVHLLPQKMERRQKSFQRDSSV